jgi:hypothetical protein
MITPRPSSGDANRWVAAWEHDQEPEHIIPIGRKAALEIGQRLYLSKHTVKTQAASIYRKLGASSRSEAVQRLQEIGLLEG